MRKVVTKTYAVPANVHEKISDIAYKEGVSTSSLVAAILENFIQEVEGNEKAVELELQRVHTIRIKSV